MKQDTVSPHKTMSFPARPDRVAQLLLSIGRSLLKWGQYYVYTPKYSYAVSGTILVIEMVMQETQTITKGSWRCMKKNANVIVYYKASNGLGAQLRQTVEQIVSRNRVEIYHTVSGLSGRLHRPATDSVVVLLTLDKNDLADIMAIQDLLFDSRIVLVLPGHEDDILAIGHSLRPRFVSFRDYGFQDVSAVLRKMTGSSALRKQ